jgi:hypothetical protein
MLEQLLPKYFENVSDTYHRQRRNKLVAEMSSLEENKLSCAKCIGNCCTFSSNSMRVTPVEAIDILHYLEGKNLINTSLINTLKSCILEFRLDVGTAFGIKKNYTCPFYLGQCKGCSISRWSKPYGCLSFNATEENVTEGKSCKSNQALLEKRSLDFQKDEDDLNRYIVKELNLAWEVESIPVALLDIIKKGELYSPS